MSQQSESVANKKRKIDEKIKKSQIAKANKKVVTYFFTKKDSDTYNCKKCNKEFAQKKGSGTTNLMNHLKYKHSSYQEEMDRGEVPTIQFASPKAQNMYSWLDWIVTGGLPFSSVLNPLFRKYSKLQPISLDTYMKYMSLLTRNVEEVIRNILPDVFFSNI